jgi:hypothetical protein
VDAGKIGHVNYLDIHITNAFIMSPPHIFKAISHFAGNLMSYKQEISAAISELQLDGFAVSGIVSDNLRVQVSAIEDVKAENGDTFVHVPCGCHCLALAIKDLCPQNSIIARAVAHIEEFSVLLTSKPILAQLKCSCPSRCMTRWRNLFDISAWIVDHMDVLSTFFNEPTSYSIRSLQSPECLNMCLEKMNQDAPILLMILQIFKILSLKLESNKTSSGCIYGYEMSPFVTFHELCQEHPILELIHEEINTAILHRLRCSPTGLLQRVLFPYFQLEGR